MDGPAADLPVTFLPHRIECLELGGGGAADVGLELLGDSSRGAAEWRAGDIGPTRCPLRAGRRDYPPRGRPRRRPDGLQGDRRSGLSNGGRRPGARPGRGSFTADLARVDVVTQPEEDGLSHHAVACPFGELSLGAQYRFDPGRFLVATRWCPAEGRLLDDQRLHQLVYLGERLLVEPAADVAGVDQLAVFVDADQECAEIFPAGPGLREAADDHLLLEMGFDLEPSAASDAWLIGAVAELGDDPFQAFLLRRLEEGHPLAEDVVRVLEDARIAHDVAQKALAVLERHFEQPLAVEVDDVENHVLHRVLFLAAVL